MMSFIATMGTAEQLDDLNTYAVILSEQCDGTGNRLEIQKALTFDESDRETGMDTYCLCTQTGATHYGGITSWQMKGNNLELLLNVEAASALGLDTTLSIELRLATNSIEKVLAGLHRLLA